MESEMIQPTEDSKMSQPAEISLQSRVEDFLKAKVHYRRDVLRIFLLFDMVALTIFVAFAPFLGKLRTALLIVSSIRMGLIVIPSMIFTSQCGTRQECFDRTLVYYCVSTAIVISISLLTWALTESADPHVRRWHQAYIHIDCQLVCFTITLLARYGFGVEHEPSLLIGHTTSFIMICGLLFVAIFGDRPVGGILIDAFIVVMLDFFIVKMSTLTLNAQREIEQLHHRLASENLNLHSEVSANADEKMAHIEDTTLVLLSTMSPFFSLTKEGSLTMWSRGMAVITGIPDASGMHIEEVFAKPDVSHLRRMLDSVCVHRQVATQEYQLKLKDNTGTMLNLTGHPRRNMAFEVIGMYCSGTFQSPPPPPPQNVSHRWSCNVCPGMAHEGEEDGTTATRSAFEQPIKKQKKQHDDDESASALSEKRPLTLTTMTTPTTPAFRSDLAIACLEPSKMSERLLAIAESLRVCSDRLHACSIVIQLCRKTRTILTTKVEEMEIGDDGRKERLATNHEFSPRRGISVPTQHTRQQQQEQGQPKKAACSAEELYMNPDLLAQLLIYTTSQVHALDMLSATRMALKVIHSVEACVVVQQQTAEIPVNRRVPEGNLGHIGEEFHLSFVRESDVPDSDTLDELESHGSGFLKGDLGHLCYSTDTGSVACVRESDASDSYTLDALESCGSGFFKGDLGHLCYSTDTGSVFSGSLKRDLDHDGLQGDLGHDHGQFFY